MFEENGNRLSWYLTTTKNSKDICPRTLAGVATPTNGEVSSEILYLLQTALGMFQLTVKGWRSNSGPVVSGRGEGWRSLRRWDLVDIGGSEVADERGDLKVSWGRDVLVVLGCFEEAAEGHLRHGNGKFLCPWLAIVLWNRAGSLWRRCSTLWVTGRRWHVERLWTIPELIQSVLTSWWKRVFAYRDGIIGDLRTGDEWTGQVRTV